jgi:hypothetical protein
VIGAVEPEVAVRDLTQIVVHELDQAIERDFVTLAPAFDEPRDLAGARWLCPVDGSSLAGDGQGRPRPIPAADSSRPPNIGP